jgi:hypothetical protein
VIIAAWCFATCVVTVWVGRQIQFRLWCRHGEWLSRVYDDLVRERQEDLDPLVMNPGVPDEVQRICIEDHMERMEQHSQMRADWAKKANSWL